MTAGLHCALWAYPWDFLDEGPEVAAARIGATGVDAVSIAVVYHPFEQVRPHLRGATLVQAETTVWFRPDPRRYRASPLQPPFVDLPGRGDSLVLLGEACAEAGLEMNAWVVCCHAITLGRQHPELCQRNVLGDRLLASLCPSQPAVQAYIRALIGDVAGGYPVRRLELEALQYLGRWPEAPHEKNGLPFGPVEHYLRGLCLCEACESRAKNSGIDTGRVVALVKSHFERFARTGEASTQPLAAFLAEQQEMARYHLVRRATMLELLRAAHDAARPAMLSVLFSGDEFTSGICPRDALTTSHLLTGLFYGPPAANLRQLEKRVGVYGVDPARLLASVIAFGPNCPDTATLSETMAAFARRGVRHFAIYNYGVMRLDQLDWIRTAIDAARSAI